MTTKALISYLEDHNVKVLGSTDTLITVNDEWRNSDGIWVESPAEIASTYDGVRDWLGY